MATSKTLKPTNTTVSIPAMTDRPNQSVNSNTMSALADAVNNLYNNANNYALKADSSSIANNTNLNTITTPGMYYSNNVTTTNKPSGFTANYYHLMVFGLVGTVIQIITDLGASEVWIRGIYGTTVGTWRKLAWAA